eukprot:9470167-Pyramimonas_sp.AAC.1
MMNAQKWCFGRIQDYAGATVMLIRGVEIPNMVLWQDSGLSRRSSQDPNGCLPTRQFLQWT